MIIGVPKEIKNNEYRVAMIPSGVEEFIKNGHEVLIETGAGLGSGFGDEDYRKAGAEIVEREIVFKRAEMIYKVKEFLQEEFKYLREGMIIFTYIHSNAFRAQTDVFLKNKVVGISYEDIEDKDGKFPLLKPMSEIAGKGGFLMAMQYTQKINDGNGLLLARIHGIRTPEVAIIGAGVAGLGAAEIASNLGNKVTILDINLDKLEKAKYVLPSNVELLYSNKENLVMCLKRSDVLMNCILWPKWRKDHLVTRDMLKFMKKGTLIVDVFCDECGAIETCRATSHDHPIYFEEGVMHYCVDNIPATFSQTATTSLCHATLPYAIEIANKGYERALKENKYLRKGLCFYFGVLTLEETGKKQNRPYKTPEQVLNI
ncbi:alanine dehydrogenase [Crassaminicella profunda]|uniref:alanine dehydrogenase n=1 Tax=Crassaminicella profunda TaxID=1286698 RepID=UPI001CA712DF|nr:alanine dehydrogenase [Crassaminicella profunda]QZY57274.1 alanine dehydrogenase [Crassaminicella profunda]